jgi:para-nitrobenzyl esterase
MRSQILGFAIAAALLASPAFAQSASDASSAPAADTSSTASHYNTAATPLGDMLDDPAAKAVLEAHIPDMINNDQISMARSLTLKALQGYAPNLTDDTLAAIDADLAKLPAK